MDKLKFAILNICVPVAVSVFVFIGIYANGFCSALENIDATSSAFEIIQGGANKGNGFYYTLSPEMFGTLGPLAYDDLNTKLYAKYGWDLDTIQIEGADAWTNEVDSQVATQFGYQVLGQNIGNLAQTVIYKISTGLGKAFGIGEKNQNGQLSVVHDGSVYYVDDDVINKVASVNNDLITDGEFKIVSDDSSIYSSNIKISGAYSNSLESSSVVMLEGNFPANIAYYTLSTQNYSVYRLKALVPTSLLSVSGNGFSIPFSGFYINGNGQKINLNSLYFIKSADYTINNVSYSDGVLQVGSTFTGSNVKFGTFDSAYNLISSDLSANALMYYYSNGTAVKDILDQLKGKYVTSTDFQSILDAINNLKYGLITDNGNTLPVIDTNADFLSNLQGIINQILANQQTLADVLNRYNTEPGPEPEPEPDPIENINQGIDIPTGFDNTLLNPFVDVIKMPFKFFTIFSPVFAIFGSTSLLSLWLFFPSFLIIMIIIWCLK